MLDVYNQLLSIYLIQYYAFLKYTYISDASRIIIYCPFNLTLSFPVYLTQINTNTLNIDHYEFNLNLSTIHFFLYFYWLTLFIL